MLIVGSVISIVFLNLGIFGVIFGFVLNISFIKGFGINELIYLNHQ